MVVIVAVASSEAQLSGLEHLLNPLVGTGAGVVANVEPPAERQHHHHQHNHQHGKI